jgi:hypothetical protein
MKTPTRRGPVDGWEEVLEWRPMKEEHITHASHLGNYCYPDHFERYVVFREKWELFPAGCRVLIHTFKNLSEPHLQSTYLRVAGYTVAFPWTTLKRRADQFPALDTFLHVLPVTPSHLFLYDIAIHPEFRGSRMGEKAIRDFETLASRLNLDYLNMIAVNGSDKLWVKQGFSREVWPHLIPAGYGAGAVAMSKFIAPG